MVPGIGFSPDKMLHGRLFSYPDAQYYRLGVNHQMIPVNAPRCPVHSYHRDGAMRVDGNYGSTLHYEPNSYGQWQEQPDYRTPPEPLGDVSAYDWNFREDDDDYFTQPRNLFALLDTEQRQCPLRQHRQGHVRRTRRDSAALGRPVRQGRPRLRRRRREGHRRAGRKLTPWTS